MRLQDNSCTCGSSASVPLFETTDFNFHTTEARSRVLQCASCGSHFPERFPLTEDLGQAYASYYTAAAPRHPTRRALRGLLDVSRGPYLSRATPPAAASVLDYGCGSGEFLLHLHHSGHSARLVGTDIARPSAADAKTFQWFPVDQLQAQTLVFDWITLSHVLEHLPDPAVVIQRLRPACAAGGGLWISTPNAQSFLTQVFGAHSRDVDFPRHRQVFSKQGLTQLLLQAGFEAQFCEVPRVNAALNLVSCLKNLWRDQDPSLAHKLRVSLSGTLQLLRHWLAAGPSRANTSPELVVVARPTGG